MAKVKKTEETEFKLTGLIDRVLALIDRDVTEIETGVKDDNDMSLDLTRYLKALEDYRANQVDREKNIEKELASLSTEEIEDKMLATAEEIKEKRRVDANRSKA